MSWFTKALSGTIGQKIIMSLTGLFLVTFLLEHLLGNLLLLRTEGQMYNDYAAFMGANPIIKAAEVVLFAGFIFHIVFAAIISYKNKKARPQGYAHNNPSNNSSWFSRNMGLTGSIIFIFLVIHLNTFFVPHKVTGTATLGLWEDAQERFAVGWYTALYVVAMGLLAFHLNHGFQSAFQTLGLRHAKYTPAIKGFGTFFAIVVPALFALIPIIIFIRQNF